MRPAGTIATPCSVGLAASAGPTFVSAPAPTARCPNGRFLGVRLRSWTVSILAGLAAACGGVLPGAEETAPAEERSVGWRVGVAEHVSLWFHGLAYVRGRDAGERRIPVPRFAPGYVDEMNEVKRRRGVYPTPLDTAAARMAGALSGEEFDGLEFLPLYFEDASALFSSFEAWAEAGGDPRRAGSAQAARVVAFLSSLFPRPQQRQAVLQFVRLLRQEQETFFASYWQEQLPALQARAADVQREWDALAPSLAVYLDYAQLENGELLIVPALGAEGRLVRGGLPYPRAAVLAPPARRPRDAVLAFVHETTYPIAGDAVRDYVAPAQIRELGEQRLISLAAVRAGAMILEETAPRLVPDYHRLYLEAIGRDVARATDEELRREFLAAFALPEALEAGLVRVVERALAGI